MTGCGAARRRAQDMMDRRSDPCRDELVKAHVTQCVACERFVRDLSRLSQVASLASSHEPSTAASVAESVFAHMAARRPAPRRGLARRPSWQTALAFGGAFAVVLLAGVQIGSWRAGPPPADVTASTSPTALPTPADDLPSATLVGESPDAADLTGAVAPGATENGESSPGTVVAEPLSVSPEPPPTVRRPSGPTRRAPIIPRGRSRVRPQPDRTGASDLQVVEHSPSGALSPVPAGVEMPGFSGPIAHSTRIQVPADSGPVVGEGGAGAPIEIIAVSPGSGL